MTETWSETCANCDCLLGDKVFTDEKEFDEHPDRELGYTNCHTHDEWLCPDCRDDDAIFCDECGDKVPAGDLEDGVCPWCLKYEVDYIENNQETIMKVLEDERLSEDDKAELISSFIRYYKIKMRDERNRRIAEICA